MGEGPHGPARRRGRRRRDPGRTRRLIPLLLATGLLLVASPAAAQAPSADLQALHLPQAWVTSTAEGVVVAVLDAGEDAPAAQAVADAAPDAEVLTIPVSGAADVAVALDDAVDQRASVVALTLGDDPAELAALGDETVQRSLQAATDAGVMVVATDPGTDVTFPDDLPIVLVGDRGVSAGDVEPARGTALVAGTAALVAGQISASGIGELLDNTADGPDHLVNAEAAVELAANMGAGGAAIPPPEDRTGGLPPALVGVLAFGIAGLVVGGTILLAGRKPRSS